MNVAEETCKTKGIHQDGITKITRFPKVCLDLATKHDPKGDTIELYKCAYSKCGLFWSKNLQFLACNCGLDGEGGTLSKDDCDRAKLMNENESNNWNI